MPLDLTSLPIIKNPLDEFDPNDRDKGTPPWATYSPSRRPSFRVHKLRAHAMAALRNFGRSSGAILYRHENGRWVEEARFQPSAYRPTRCESCQQPTMTDDMCWDYQTRTRIPTGRKVNSGRYTLVRSRGKILDPVQVMFVCLDCQRGNPDLR